jgi:hypothetical protein
MIDMTVLLHDEHGRPIPDIVEMTDGQTPANCPSLTLGAAVAHALFASYPDEQSLGWERKFARGSLAQSLRDNPEAEIESGDLTLIKTLLGKMYGVAVIMAAIPLLDPAARPGKIS